LFGLIRLAGVTLHAGWFDGEFEDNQPFERCVLSEDEALEFFGEDPFKVQLIAYRVPDGVTTSCDRNCWPRGGPAQAVKAPSS